jgi:hypothetical protein
MSFVFAPLYLLFTAGCRLMYRSSLRALLFDNPLLTAMRLTGRRDFVYFAPFPALCFWMRLVLSLVIPQYRELSAQRTK